MLQGNIPQQAEQYAKKRERRKVWHRIVMTLACIVVFCTTYALILPAITMERAPSCGLEEHQHTELCYKAKLICGFDEAQPAAHTHSEGCYEQQQILVCGREESAGHIHSDSCIYVEQTLTCAQEHEHTPECYTASRTYVCGMAEGEGAHTHSQECYETRSILICTTPEQQPHVHTNACYETVLVCQKEEHVHSDECYPSSGEETTEPSEEDTEATEETTDPSEEATEETEEETEPEEEIEVPELEPYVTGTFFTDTVYDAAADHFDTVMHVSFRVPVSVISAGELYECNYQLPGKLSPRADAMWGVSNFHFGTAYSSSAARAGAFRFTYEGNHCLCVLDFDRNAVTGDVVEGNFQFAAEISPNALQENGTILLILSNGVGVSIPAPEMPTPETEPTETTTEATEETTEATEETTEAIEETTEATEETTEAIEETTEATEETTEATEETTEATEETTEAIQETTEASEDPAEDTEGATEEPDEEAEEDFDLMFDWPVQFMLSRGYSARTSRTDMRPYIGKDTNFTSAKYNPVTNQVEVGFHMTFAMSKNEIQAAQYAYTYALPEGIIIPDNMLGTTYSGYDQNGELGFTYQFVADGDGTYSILVDFVQSYVDSRDHFSGYINFSAYAGENAGQEGGGYSFKFSDDCTVTIPADKIQHEDNESQDYNINVSKSNGGYDSENNKITYTVTVSSSKGTPDPLNLTDILTADGLTVSSVGNISVIRQDLASWGGPFGEETSVECTPNFSDNNLSMSLPALSKNDDNYGQQYTITYDVYLNEPAAGSTYTVDNKVTVTGTDSQKGQTVTSSAESHVSIDKSLTLGKYGTYDKAANKIKWTITVNQNGNNIAGTILTDAAFAGQTLTIEPNNGYTLGEDNSITFTNVEGSDVNKQKYTITYETYAPETGEAGTATVTNTATITPPEGGTPKEVTATVTVDKRMQMSKSGSYDKTSDTIAWTITVNENGNDIAGAELTDKMFSQVKASDIKVSPDQIGMNIESNEDGTIQKISFTGVDGDTNTRTYVITYTTSSGVDLTQTGTVKNTATFDPNPGTEGDEITSGPGVWVDRSLGFDKWDGWYNSADEGIWWKISINSNYNNIAGFTLTDDMLGKIDPDKFKINYQYVTSGSNVDGVTITWNDDGTIGSIKFTGIGETGVNTNNYTIEYLVAAKPGWDAVTLTNTATLTPPGGTPIEDSGSAQVPADGNVFKKCMGGTMPDADGKISITWRTEIKVPADGLPAGTVVTDTLANDGQWMDWLQIQKWGSVLFAKNIEGQYLQGPNYWWPAGQTYTILFYATDGTTCTYDDIVANTNGAQNKKFTKYELTFVNGVDKTIYGGNTIYFEYDSYVNVSDVADSATYKNTVSVTPPDGNPKSSEASYTYKKPGVVKMDGNGNTGPSSIATSDGVLTWRVRVRLDADCTTLTVTDTLPAGVTLTELTFANKPLTISDSSITGDPDGLTAVGTISPATVDSEEKQVVTLTVTLPSDVTAPSYFKENGEFYLVYTCKISNMEGFTDGQKIGTFTNSVTVTRDSNTFGSSSQTQEVTYTSPTSGMQKVDKNGGWNNDARILEYSILLNPNGDDLLLESDTLTLTDTLSHWIGTQTERFDVALLPGSVKLYHATVAADGSYTKGDLVQNWSWKVETREENGNMHYSTITATIPDKTPLVLEYNYRVWVPEGSDFDNGNATYNGLYNKATLSGETSWSDESKFDVKWENSETSAGITSDRAYVFYKVEQGNYGNRLPGAVFTLYDANGNALKTYTTDSNGSFTIQWQEEESDYQFLHNTLYYVKETAAPDGYLLPDNPQQYWFFFRDSTDTTPSLPDIIPEGAVDLSATAGIMYCENEKNNTGITVQKQWFTEGGAENSNPSVESISFDLYRLASTIPPTEGSESSGESGGGTGGGSGSANGVTYSAKCNYSVMSGTFSDVAVGDTVKISVTYTWNVTGNNVQPSGWSGVTVTSGGYSDDGFTYDTICTITSNSISFITGDQESSIRSITCTLVSSGASEETDPDESDSSGTTEVPTSGEKIGSYTISSTSNWTWSKSDLPKLGKDEQSNTIYYSYYVVETTTGYDVSYENNGGIASGTITIKNTETSEEKTSITVKKTWVKSDGSEQTVIPETEITFDLYQKLGDGEAQKYQSDSYKLTAANSWQMQFSSLPKYGEDGATLYTYYVVETTSGYRVSYSTDGQNFTQSDVSGAIPSGTITIRNVYDTTDISVEKKWLDGELTIEPLQNSISYALYRKAGESGTGEPVGQYQLPTEDSQWKATHSGLAKYDSSGTEYIYYVVEDTTGTNFVTTYETAADGTLVIKNHLSTTSIMVKKEWTDASGNALPALADSISYELWRKTESSETGEKVGDTTFTLTAENSWTYTHENLPAEDDSGKAYTYYVVETTTGYQVSYSTDGTNFGTVQSSGSAASGAISKGTITIRNSYDTVDIPVSKQWFLGETSLSADYPLAQIEYKLYRKTESDETGVQVGETTFVLTGTNNWAYTHEKLPAKDSSGNAYTYYVEETTTGGFTTTYETAENGTLVIKNTVPTTSISVEKKWLNADGSDLTLTEGSVTFDLYRIESAAQPQQAVIADGQNGTKVNTDPLTIIPSNWTATVDNLPTMGTSNGQRVYYTYYVVETAVDGYDATYAANGDTNTITITNTKQPETASITVKKVWGTGTDGYPDSITFNLYQLASGETSTDDKTPILSGLTVKSQSADEEEKDGYAVTYGDWTTTISNLTKTGTSSNNQTVTYVYVVKETTTGYDVTYSNNDGITSGEITITNTKTTIPGGTSLTVEKVWKDAEGNVFTPSSDSNLSIDLDLYQVSVSNSSGTGVSYQYTSNGSTVVESGTLSDVQVGSTVQVTVTMTYDCTHWQPTITLTGMTKQGDGSWTHSSNSVYTILAQITADSIVVDVGDSAEKFSVSVVGRATAASLSDSDTGSNVSASGGSVYGSVTLNSSNGWQHTFTGLPLTGTAEDGTTQVSYYYYLKEVSVPAGYTVSYSNGEFAVQSGTITITNSQTTTPSGTQLKVKKEWKDANGDDLTTTSGYSVVVQLHQVATTIKDGTSSEKTTSLGGQNGWNNYTLTDDQLASNPRIRVTYTTDANYYNWGYGAISKYVNGEWQQITELRVASGTAGTYSDTVELPTDSNLFALNFWGSYTPEGGTEITYATLNSVDLIETVITGGTTTTVVNENFMSGTLDSNGNWEYTWSNLPANDGANTTYTYYVEEVSVTNGSEANFADLFNVTVDYGDAEHTVGPSGTVIVTNTLKSTFTLPETGGGGAKPYTLGGLLLCFTAGALLLYSHSRRRKEDSISS